jgi:hypothetical protein
MSVSVHSPTSCCFWRIREPFASLLADCFCIRRPSLDLGINTRYPHAQVHSAKQSEGHKRLANVYVLPLCLGQVQVTERRHHTSSPDDEDNEYALSWRSGPMTLEPILTLAL